MSSEIEVRDLHDDERAFHTYWINLYKQTYEQSLQKKCDRLNLENLEEFYPYLKLSIRWSRKRRNNTVSMFGTCFGQLFVENLNYKWVVLKDKDGDEVCVLNEQTGQYVFPYSIVRKRVKKKIFNYFEPIFESFRESDSNYNID